MRGNHPRGRAAWSRCVGAGGIVLGAALVTNGPRMFAWIEQRQPHRTERDALTVLGLRHVVQGAAQLAFPRLFSKAYITVDVLHSASMVIMATRSPSRRSSTLLSAVVAGASALLTTTGLPHHRTGTALGAPDELS